MAKDWMDTIRGIYKDKSTPKGGFSTEIVKRTGKELSTAVDRGTLLQGIDYDMPDYKAREVLKNNVWKFSVAKNYNDCIALSNLLVRKNGSIRPWYEFKREAMKVVGRSNRYLKTEYDTIVAGAMMSRKWQEIQRDKHLFPFVQFKVTLDDHTSEICTPLSNVIVQVDDPFLQHYFPPNHFNCRTDVIKLRNATPTPQHLLPYIDIPSAFLNNVGATGEIFTEENSYIENTPKKVLNKAEEEYINDTYLKRYSDIEFKKVKIGKGKLDLPINGEQTKSERYKNKNALSILAENGKRYKLLPVIEDGQTNPDAFNLIK
ncbi:phage minor head protein, partial [Ornithobacterium rhinotracheale]